MKVIFYVLDVLLFGTYITLAAFAGLGHLGVGVFLIVTVAVMALGYSLEWAKRRFLARRS